MPWDAQEWDSGLLAFYRALIQLRRTQPALRHGARRTVHLDAPAGTYAYVRSLAGPAGSPDTSDPGASGSDTPAPGAGDSDMSGPGAAGPDVLAVFNLSGEDRTISLPLEVADPSCSCLLSTGAAPRIMAANGALHVTLAARTAAAIGRDN